jgi:hypothetical protein
VTLLSRSAGAAGRRRSVGGDPGGTTPFGRTEDFLDTIGVNTHFYYGGAGQAYLDHTATRAALAELGVRNIRDLYWDNTTQKNRMIAVHNDFGIMVNALIDRNIGSVGYSTADQALGQIVAYSGLADAIYSLEGPNEWDGGGRPQEVAAATEAGLLKTARDSRPALEDKPLVAPSMASPQNCDLMGDISASVDYGNLHSYPGGMTPDATANGGDWSLAGWLTHAASAAVGKSAWATETGYHNAIDAGNAHEPTTERAAGIYTPQLYLEYWRRGVVKTFMYELVDEYPDSPADEREKNFGLYRNDWTQKPAAANLERLTTLLDGGTPGVTLVPLGFSFTNALATTRSVLMQKTSTEWWLAVYQDVSVYTPTTAGVGTELFPADDALTLNLTSPRNVTVYDVASSLTPISSASGVTSHALSVPVSPLLVKVN